MKKINQFQALKNFISRVFAEVILFSQTPKNYLYLFTYPTNKYVSIIPFSPELQVAAHKIIERIQKVAPGLKIYFVGSARFGLPGQNDIDLIASCSYKNFHLYLPKIIKIFGYPVKKRSKFIEWNFFYKSYRIDLLLADPSNPTLKRQLTAFRILRKNNKLLKEYESIKSTLNGKSIREYEKIKLSFFNKLFRLNNI